MPSVPVYRRQVEERGLPDARLNVQTDASTVGAGPSFDRVINSAERLVGGIADQMEKEQQKADKLRYDKSRVALNGWERDNIYDSEKGAAATVGEQAFGINKTLKDSYEKFSQDYRKTLANDRQRIAFDGLTAERWDHISKWAEGHISKQRDVVEESTYVSSLESSKDRAALDTTTIPMELAQISDTILERWRGKLPTEAIQQEIVKHETDLHDRVIGSYLSNGQDAQAKDYFEKNISRIDVDKRPAIQNKIKLGEERIKKEKTEQLELSALNVIEKTGDFDGLPDAVKEALPRESRSALRNYAKAVSKGEDVETDLDTYYGLGNMSDAQLKNVNLIELKDKLSPTDWKKWADIQRDIRGGAKSAGLDGFRTDLQVVDESMRAAGLDPAKLKKTKEGSRRYAEFHKAVETRQMELQKQMGKKTTNEDLQRISEDLLLKKSLTKPGLLWDSKKEKFAFEMKEVERRMKDGRVAVFDAETQLFVRWK